MNSRQIDKLHRSVVSFVEAKSQELGLDIHPIHAINLIRKWEKSKTISTKKLSYAMIQATDMSPLEEKIVEFMREAGTGVTRNQIVLGANVKLQTLTGLIKNNMLPKGIVRVVGEAHCPISGRVCELLALG